MSLTTAAITVMARTQQGLNHSYLLLIGLFLATAVTVYIVKKRPRTAYLIDYACFRAPSTYRIPYATFVEHLRQVSHFSERSIRFITRLLESSGLGEETSLPYLATYLQGYKYATLEEARKEVELVIFSAIDDLFTKASIDPTTIGIVVVNCSGFSPTPSMPDMIVNKYKMRSDIRCFHLSGMGCSAGLISVDLATNLLQTMPQGARALVVSTETLTPNYYLGNERAMLLPYCLFRMGASAVLLSTSPAKARFRLKCIVRTLTAADDKSYKCIHQEEDDKGNTGANLTTDIVDVAATTLKINITTLAPLILPIPEKLMFARSFVSKKLFKRGTKLYMPNLTTGFDHICVHAGGRAVIDGIQRSLGLSDDHVEPSRMTLHRFGNTSSSSLWYELAYIEAKRHMHKGGSGVDDWVWVWVQVQ
ncbi:unnamed protein product [Urochloa humidicola]